MALQLDSQAILELDKKEQSEQLRFTMNTVTEIDPVAQDSDLQQREETPTPAECSISIPQTPEGREIRGYLPTPGTISRTPAPASLGTIPEHSELPSRPPDLVPASIPVPPPPLPSLEPLDRLNESQEPLEPPEILKEHLMAYTHLPSTASQDITVST